MSERLTLCSMGSIIKSRKRQGKPEIKDKTEYSLIVPNSNEYQGDKKLRKVTLISKNQINQNQNQYRENERTRKND